MLGVVLAVAGCTSGGTGALSPTGGINNSNGASNGTGGANTPPANSTATITCTVLPCTNGEGLTLQSLNLPAGAGVTVTSITLQVSSVATGAPALPAGTCSNAGTACLIVSGTITLSGAPAVNGTPTFVFTNTNWPIPGHSVIKGAFIDSTGATQTIEGSFGSSSATIPSLATFTWPITNTALYTIYVV